MNVIVSEFDNVMDAKVPLGDASNVPLDDAVEVRVDDEAELSPSDKTDLAVDDQAEVPLNDASDVPVGDEAEMRFDDEDEVSLSDEADLSLDNQAKASFNDETEVRLKASLIAEKPASASSLKRANRWKRRSKNTWSKKIYLVAGCLLAGFAAAAILSPKSINMQQGLEGPFANAIFDAFPEAEPSKIDTWYKDDLPQTATLHLPAYMIEPRQGIGNPFARLGVEFGGSERTLSGVEMASRLEKIGHSVLPEDVLRCHSYDIGPISSEPESPRRTRILHLHLNPGC